MNAKYIDDHMAGVHTEESFGRALIEQAMKAAKTQLASGDQPSVSINAKIEVSELVARGCVNVTIYIGPVSITKHVNV